MATNFSPINSEFQSQYLIGMWQTVYIYLNCWFFLTYVYIYETITTVKIRNICITFKFSGVSLYSLPSASLHFPSASSQHLDGHFSVFCCYRLVGFSRILHEQNATEGPISCLVSFRQNNYFEIHPCFDMSW